MTVLAAILAVSLVVTVGLFLRHIAGLERAWTVERRELVNRVQAPDRLPVDVPVAFHVPDAEPDESGLVGSIQYDSEG